ncbi:MAG TPA: glutamate-1-semialdehyde 2,1-aminomutase [Candidatus Methylacidiphilales bacterium]|jgi:glutamate-1-semialdehyde 2,1-aminomutase|nr:glutamate-1-semialdehyde 2,1-aminomutase [Candidatus Methylacidiphilales bacterium]
MSQTRSQELFAEALRYIPGGVNSPVRAFRAVGGTPFFAQKARGSRVEDIDGNSYIDYVCTWGPSILGHAHPDVIAAVKAAADRGTSFGIPNPLEVELARKICEWVPSVQKVRMTNSGTEATMSAIRLARGFTRRDKIVKFEGCYHGHVDSLLVKAGSGALTLGRPDSAGIPAALAALTLALPFNNADALRLAFEGNKGEIAAVIVEPIPANAGLILPAPGYLETMRELCTAHGTLLIFDEVMTGFRLARGGAQELLGVRPDLSCFGKVIGGGLPVGAFGGRADVMDFLAPLGPVYQAGTLSGNPLAMAAGLVQLKILEEQDIFEKLEKLGAQLETETRAALKSAGLDDVFYRIGSMFCLFFTGRPVRNLDDAKTSDLDRFARFFHAMLARGIYIAPSQFETGFISAAHTGDDLAETGQAIRHALRAI